MTFVVFFPLLSLCFSFSFWLSLASLSAIPAPRLLCWDLVPGEDLERNDGSSSRPYYMSAGLHKILRKGEEGAKLCTASWAMCGHFNCTVDSHSLLHIYCMCGGGSGCLRASTVGLFIKTGCIPAWSRTAWTWLLYFSFHRKGIED